MPDPRHEAFIGGARPLRSGSGETAKPRWLADTRSRDRPPAEHRHRACESRGRTTLSPSGFPHAATSQGPWSVTWQAIWRPPSAREQPHRMRPELRSPSPRHPPHRPLADTAQRASRHSSADSSTRPRRRSEHRRTPPDSRRDKPREWLPPALATAASHQLPRPPWQLFRRPAARRMEQPVSPAMRPEQPASTGPQPARAELVVQPRSRTPAAARPAPVVSPARLRPQRH